MDRYALKFDSEHLSAIPGQYLSGLKLPPDLITLQTQLLMELKKKLEKLGYSLLPNYELKEIIQKDAPGLNQNKKHTSRP